MAGPPRSNRGLDLLNAQPPRPAPPVLPVADALDVYAGAIGRILLPQASLEPSPLQPAAQGRRVHFGQHRNGEAHPAAPADARQRRLDALPLSRLMRSH